ncbi:MAG: PAS domain-containing protein, partial [Candidatus Methanomethylicia archaeon]
PIDLLLKENEYLLKKAEALNVYGIALAKAVGDDEKRVLSSSIMDVLNGLRKIRTHYRKIQMLVFPYLEKRGVTAVPRVLWGREDEVIVKMRSLFRLMDYQEISKRAIELANAISEIIFRENRILFPAVWALFSEGEWAAFMNEANRIGWIVKSDVEWASKEKPIMPYEVKGVITKEQLDKLPQEMKIMALSGGVHPDEYELIRNGDFDLNTGFLNIGEIKSIFPNLPLELTFADKDDRVRFFVESKLYKGFIRTKTILGRRVEYCHPPRLEAFIRKVLDELKSGVKDHEVFWTRMGDRILRVMVVAIKDDNGKYIGALEVVEDLTEVVENPEEVKRKILVM